MFKRFTKWLFIQSILQFCGSDYASIIDLAVFVRNETVRRHYADQLLLNISRDLEPG